MSDVRLSNASPTVERVDARPPDSARSARRVLFGAPDPGETRRRAEALQREAVEAFRDRYNFDPLEDRPLSPGNYEWEEDGDAPEFYRRPPRGGGDDAARRREERPAAGSGSRKRSARSAGCRCDDRKSKKSHSDEGDSEDEERQGLGAEYQPEETACRSGEEKEEVLR